MSPESRTSDRAKGAAGAPANATLFSTFRLIAHVYRLRVRENFAQEALAMLGIAAGVALLFAVQSSTANFAGSVDALTDEVVGKASLEIVSRGAEGMPQSLLDRVASQPHVKAAAPLVIDRVTVMGNGQERSLTLVGVDRRLRKTESPAFERLVGRSDDLDVAGLVLTSATAKAIGARPGDRVGVEVGSSTKMLLLVRTIGSGEAGLLAESPVAFVPLGQAQELMDRRGRLNRILVVPATDASDDAARELRAIAGDSLDVRSTSAESRYLADAMKADAQSSLIFSSLAVAIALLFAYNAMMLSLPARRRIAHQLRTLGASRGTIVASLAFDAVLLGLFASCAGLILGELLARSAFDDVPVYLAVGFPVGDGRAIELSAVAVSIAGGLAAALLAAAKPAHEILSTTADDSEAGDSGGRRLIGAVTGSRSLLFSALIVVGASITATLVAAATPIAIGASVIALMLATSTSVMKLLSLFARSARVRGRIEVSLAVNELFAGKSRTVAVSVIAATAVMAMVAIGGARQDLQRGVDELIADVYNKHDLWVSTGGAGSIFLTSQFDPVEPERRMKDVPTVRTLHVHRGSFLDFRGRRVRIYASATKTPAPLVARQVIEGDFESASTRLRRRGWMVSSKAIADDLGVKPGDDVELPTPAGTRTFRLAATTANYGWPSGTILLNGDDYRSAWQSNNANVIGIDLEPGTNPNAAAPAVQAALGENSSLNVQTAREMADLRGRVSEQGTSRIRQIWLLVLGASALAIVAAMFAAIWMRRNRLAVLRAAGLYRRELYGTVLIETILLVALGGAIGLVFGFALQHLADTWAEFSSGYDTMYEPAVGLGIASWSLVMLLSAIATLGPAYLATRISPGLRGVE